jgi:hypothetical protein
VGILFFAGLLLGLRNVTARRIRYFTMLCLGVLVIVQALGKTSLSTISPELNSENQLVLLTPLAAIFGAAFFLTLLNQMKVPSLRTGYGVIALLALLACQPLATALLSKTSPPSFPPYFPPDIQRVAGWMHEDELMMSDVPWAVAWYGDRQCAWTTLNSQSEFYALNDYLKRVQALYLSMNTLNGRLITECMQGGADGWNRFVLKAITANQYPNGFPLMPFTSSEPQLQSPGLFLTDRPRWPSE